MSLQLGLIGSRGEIVEAHKKIVDRYNILTFILVLLLSALVFRLSTLTIVKGDEYRDIADNRRLKEISTTAARGEIRDRYGRPLAINKPSFTVQILKDELLAIKDKGKRNNVLLSLIRLLEEDGVSYIDEFPINLNTFRYIDERDYEAEEISPIDKVIEIINNENMLREILLSSYREPAYEEHYKFIMAERAIYALENKVEDIPILVNVDKDNFELEYDQDLDIAKWKKTNNLGSGLGPMDAILELIGKDKTIIRKIIDHPISRGLVYDILLARGLNGNITIEEYSLTYDEEYLNQKRILIDLYDEVTEQTSAKEDFINVF